MRFSKTELYPLLTALSLFVFVLAFHFSQSPGGPRICSLSSDEATEEQCLDERRLFCETKETEWSCELYRGCDWLSCPANPYWNLPAKGFCGEAGGEALCLG